MLIFTKLYMPNEKKRRGGKTKKKMSLAENVVEAHTAICHSWKMVTQDALCRLINCAQCKISQVAPKNTGIRRNSHFSLGKKSASLRFSDLFQWWLFSEIAS